MKVLDLQCELRHGFEGWFADEHAFVHQQATGLIECPLCGNRCIEKKLSAPRLNLGATAKAASAPAGDGELTDAGPALARWHAHAREVLARTENVGERFASEARAMHDGDLPPRPIRGVASAEQVKDLVADGVEVLPVPPSLVEPLH